MPHFGDLKKKNFFCHPGWSSPCPAIVNILLDTQFWWGLLGFLWAGGVGEKMDFVCSTSNKIFCFGCSTSNKTCSAHLICCNEKLFWQNIFTQAQQFPRTSFGQYLKKCFFLRFVSWCTEIFYVFSSTANMSTRLGEFSPIGWSFTLGSNSKVDKLFGYSLPP
jgi:hypothetical protein